LSPLLFVVVIKALSKMISTTVNGGLLSGFSVESRNLGALNISYILFANNNLIFYKANSDHLCYLGGLFLCFEAVSNLRINMATSKLVLVSNVNNVDGLASIMGCRVSSLTLKYLGLPVGDSFKAISFWDDIIEKIERCLVDEKGCTCLRVGGYLSSRAHYPICLLISCLFSPFLLVLQIA
jgi:hypothetical protein